MQAAPKRYRRLTILTVLLAAGVFVLDLLIPLGVAGGVPYVAVILLSRWSPWRRDTWLAAIGSSVLTILGLIFSPEAGGIMWMVLFNRFLALLAIWVTAFFCLQFKRAEERLRVSEHKYRTLFETAGDAIFTVKMIDEGPRFVDCNMAALEMFGYPHEEMVKKSPADLSPPVQPSGKSSATMAMQVVKAALAGEPQAFQWTHCRLDGTPFDAEVTLNRVEMGTEVHLQATVRDVTQRVRAEAEREELIAKLEIQNTELERFTYTVSHDLKTPLITLKGFIGLLQDNIAGGDDETVDEALARMSNAADTMWQLLNELLELSRIGRVVNPPEEVSLEELAREAVELVGGRISQDGVRVQIAPDLPVVFGDRQRLLEVMQNLVDNAVKYMGDQPHPCVEIGVRSENHETVCYVHDNGIGVEPAYHEKIFGLFNQLDPNAEGTGIGLALVKRIVEVHGGSIWVESESPGMGSTFCFTCPSTAGSESLAAR